MKPYNGMYRLPPRRSIVTDTPAGTPTSVVEVIGEPNREAKIRRSEYNGGQKSSEKAGTVPK